MTLGELNLLPTASAMQELLQCCGSREWAVRMAALRPFSHEGALLEEADRVWLQLGEVDWLEAFAAHPRIGQSTTSQTAQREQALALSADDEIKSRLAAANAEYEARFGFIFIVFASGKTPEQMLELLHARMNNVHAVEIRKAAAEQMKITRLRLQRLVGGT